MSNEIYYFEPAEQNPAGHSLKEKVTAVYKLEGFIERRYRNASGGGSPIPYWAYAERGGKETGIESEASAEAVEKLITGEDPNTVTTEQQTPPRKLSRLYVGLEAGDGTHYEAEKVLACVASHVESFTAYETTGYYKGKPLPTVVVDLATSDPKLPQKLAGDLAFAFGQEAVGLVRENTYERIPPTRRGPPEDQQKLSAFVGGLNEGKSFDELDAELQAWWLNRY